MKKILFTLILAITSTANIMAAEENDIQILADKIASAIATPLFNYDEETFASIITTMVADSGTIRAIELFDNTSESILLGVYKTEDNQLHSGKSVPADQKKLLQELHHPVVYEQEEIGVLQLYYRSSGESTLNLTTEERAWIRVNPEIRVGNEIDWPPFDFVENGKPMGYSIDFFKLIAQKVGLKTQFINGYTWAELLDMLKDGELDVLPAIYETEERKKKIAFTTGYYSQPMVMLVSSRSHDINNPTDLSGKRLAAIKGFAINDMIAKKYPEPVLLFSGGVFQNRVLVEKLRRRCEKDKRRYYFQNDTPINDGGIALGQAWYGLHRKN